MEKRTNTKQWKHIELLLVDFFMTNGVSEEDAKGFIEDMSYDVESILDEHGDNI